MHNNVQGYRNLNTSVYKQTYDASCIYMPSMSREIIAIHGSMTKHSVPVALCLISTIDSLHVLVVGWGGINDSIKSLTYEKHGDLALYAAVKDQLVPLFVEVLNN